VFDVRPGCVRRCAAADRELLSFLFSKRLALLLISEPIIFYPSALVKMRL